MRVLLVTRDEERAHWAAVFEEFGWESVDLEGGGGKADLFWIVDDGHQRGPGALMGTMEDPPPVVVVSDRAGLVEDYLYGYGASKVVTTPKTLGGTRRLVGRIIGELWPETSDYLTVELSDSDKADQ